MKISVVTSLYKSEKYVGELYNKLIDVLKKIGHDYEIIFVDDGYPDKALEISYELAQKDKKLKVIKLSRNFGQHVALTAGLDVCSGDLVVVMDSDLQDDPSEIKNLYNKIIEGYDIVWARREERKDIFFKRIQSFLFYKTLSYLTDTKWDHSVANFGIFTKKTIDSLLLVREQNRSFPILMAWMGFKSTSISVSHNERLYDSSSYNLKKLIHLATNIIIYFSDKPLKVFVKLGFLISSFGFVYVLKIIWSALFYGQSVQGWSSLMASIWLLSGVIILIIGICGLYIGNIFREAKKRPIYIIDKKINF